MNPPPPPVPPRGYSELCAEFPDYLANVAAGKASPAQVGEARAFIKDLLKVQKTEAKAALKAIQEYYEQQV
ncbi:hypothetical protein HDU98_010537 [Podochytrium sp. JEL0797]|nr:hypothetical protein HDU98_010537 [Podochytrium sp. JEL0797]